MLVILMISRRRMRTIMIHNNKNVNEDNFDNNNASNTNEDNIGNNNNHNDNDTTVTPATIIAKGILNFI